MIETWLPEVMLAGVLTMAGLILMPLIGWWSSLPLTLAAALGIAIAAGQARINEENERQLRKHRARMERLAMPLEMLPRPEDGERGTGGDE